MLKDAKEKLKKTLFQASSQQGVTLLLAILVLSAILAISFSVATILFVEIRTSGDLIRTENSLYAAESVAEENVFVVKRDIPECSATQTTYCYTAGSGGYTSAIGNNQLTSVALPNNPSIKVKITSGSVFSQTDNTFRFFDPTDPIGGSDFGKFTISYINTGNVTPTDKLNVYVCQFDPTFGVDDTGATANTYRTAACSYTGDNQSGYWIPPIVQQLAPGATQSWSLDPSKQQQLFLENLSGKDIYAEIDTFAADQVTAKGLPTFGEKYFNIDSANSGLNRRLQVRIPLSSGNNNVVTNLAQGKTATESSVAFGATADRAVDGNTDGSWSNNSVTHTNFDANAWWNVDLGASGTINTISIWNRMDCCSSRLGDYWVFVSDTPFNPSDTPATLQSRAGTWSSHQTSAPNPSTNISVGGAKGRYVRVQLSGTDYLSLAEVQVFGY